MVDRVCWTELTDSSSYGGSCGWMELTVAVMVHRMFWTELIDSSSYDTSCMLDGTD
jgi:hypothetical protein